MKKLVAICFSIVFVIYSFVSFREFEIDSNKAMIDGKIRIELDRYETAQNLAYLLRDKFIPENISMTYQTVDKDGDKYIYTYYKTDDDFSDVAHKVTSRIYDKGYLAPGHDECYSTMPLEGYNCKNMPISNLEREVIVFNWSEAVKKDLSIDSFFVPRDKADKALEILKSVGFSKAKIIQGAFIDNEESTRFNALFFPVCVGLLCVFLYVLLNAKQYALQKMEGYSSKHIILQEFKSVRSLSSISFFVVIGISLVVAKIIFNNAAFWNFCYSFLCRIALFGIIIDAIIFAIIAILIKSESDKNYLDYVKGRVSQKTAYTTTIVAKSVFLLSMITAVSISLRCVERDFYNYNRAKTLEEKLAGYVTAVPDNFELKERHCVNDSVFPFLSEKEDEFIQLYTKVSDEYDGILCQYVEFAFNAFSERIPELVVNASYFSENPVFLENGEQIKKEDIDKNREYVIYPMNREDKESIEEFSKIKYETEPIFLTYDPSKSKICAYDVAKGEGPENLLKEPILAVRSETKMIPTFSYHLCAKDFFIKAHTEDPVAEITPMLKEMFNWDFKVESLAKSFYDRTFDARDLFLRSLINSLLFMAATLCFIFASAKLYCENHKKKISQALVDGFSLWRSIKNHLITIIVTNVSVGLLLLISKPSGAADSADIRVIVACLVADLVISIALCAKYARANLQKILKGADV